MKRERMTVIILLGVIVLLWFIKSLLENSLNDKGIQITKLQEQSSVLHKQNTLFEDQLLQESAYTFIYQKAIQQGYRQASYLFLR